MKESKPSQTASFVALARALADRGFTTVPGFRDPIAQELLSRGWRALLEIVARMWSKADRRQLRSAIAQLDVIPLRVTAIDTSLEAAVASGCRQVVILGAGLDTRAFRLAALADANVYEVDHPATQAYKRSRAAVLRPLSKSYAFVSVDFEKDSLFERLVGSPTPVVRPLPAVRGGDPAAPRFDPAQPTVWLWEGVVMYLSDHALSATLREIARASPVGSYLIVNYHEPVAGRRHPVLRALLSLWGEPQVGHRSRDTMHEQARRAGFSIATDTGSSEWAAALGAGQPAGETAKIARILVARHD